MNESEQDPQVPSTDDAGEERTSGISRRGVLLAGVGGAGLLGAAALATARGATTGAQVAGQAETRISISMLGRPYQA